jgi:hypothetical protein
LIALDSDNTQLIMAGLVPATHVFDFARKLRGCPALRPGMKESIRTDFDEISKRYFSGSS